MRRFVSRRGRRVRRMRRGRLGRTLALLAAAACVGALVWRSGMGAWVAEAVGGEVAAAVLALEFERERASRAVSSVYDAHVAAIEQALGPAVSLSGRSEAYALSSDEPAASVRPSADADAGVSEPPSDEPRAEPSEAPSPADTATLSGSASAVPSRETNAADLDPAIRTVSIRPTVEAGYDYADGVFVKNGTSAEIDVASFLEGSLELENFGVLIVHTHASEAYHPDGDDLYEPTDTERTEDTNYNVVRVGDKLAAALEARGVAVTHIREIFDYPSYSGSYERTLDAIESALDANESISIVIDLHRDAIEGADGSTWRVVSEQADGEYAAQSMLVVGTAEGGLKHPEWRKNLLFAVHLQKFIVDRHPTLMRPIALSSSRYNQHVSPAALILEVGTSGNTLDEALRSAELIGECLGDFIAALSAAR